jgi:IS605 OrfB family transposase
MQIQRTISIVMAEDPDLRATLAAFQCLKQRLSASCYNDGQPLPALALHRAMYSSVKGVLSSQLTCTAIRLVAGAYAGAKANRRPATKPFGFHRASALFLVGKRGRDARFCGDGTLSMWTTAGRKRIAYTVPEAFRDKLAQAVEVDSINVVERGGRLLGRVALTLNVPTPQGILPVGVDLNETNAIVAVDADGREFFYSGHDHKVRTRRTQKTRARLQRKLVTRKAQKQDTRSIRRLLKRQGRRQRNRTRTFCRTAAKRLIQWAPANCVLVLEDLKLPRRRKGERMARAVRRRLNQWPSRLMGECITSKAEEAGDAVAKVNPYRTSLDCSRCGLPGIRSRHRFYCPHCEHKQHADVNAARNVRNRYTALRCRGVLSVTPEAQEVSTSVGKPSPLGDGR